MPLLRRWMSLLASRTGSGNRGFLLLQSNSSFTTGAQSATVSLPNPVVRGDVIIVAASIQNGSGATPTISAYLCSDNLGNTYTKQINSTDNSNGQGDCIFSGPVTIAGTITAITFSFTFGGTAGTCNILLGAYEFQGLSNATAQNTHHGEGGGTSFTFASSGSVVVSATSCTQTGGAVAFSSGSSDHFDFSHQNAQGIARGKFGSVWSFTGTITFDEYCEAGFI